MRRLKDRIRLLLGGRKRTKETALDKYWPVSASSDLTGDVAYTEGTPKGRKYGDATITGPARVQQGDNVTVNYYYGKGNLAGTGSKLHESLLFARMGARERNVAAALPNTCNWLFEHSAFKQWIDKRQLAKHNGFLWIKGKPGSGKSTLMKAILSWAKKTHAPETTISYFFNARAVAALEKSSLGLYRSLVFQLLVAQKNLMPLFLERFAFKENGRQFTEEWDAHELQNFLLEAVQMKWTNPLIVFVDALDEGSEDDVRDLVAYLEDLSQTATVAGTPLRICLSSRHYPHITIRKGVSLILEDQTMHDRDIELYVDTKLLGSSSPEMEQVRQEILKKSSGIFLWVVLVVNILNKVWDKSQGTDEMLRKLRSIPPGLHELFQNILLRDDENAALSVALFQWVLYSQRPLAPLELYTALKRDFKICEPTTAANYRKTIPETDANLPSDDEVKRFLLNVSRGLVEITMSNSPVVQFIHESVRDFLFENNVAIRQLDSRQNVLVVPSDFSAPAGHAVLAEDCLTYLLSALSRMDDIYQQISARTAEYLRKIAASASVDSSNHRLDCADLKLLAHRSFPLLDYVVEFSWRHTTKLTATSSGQSCKLALQLFEPHYLERLCIFSTLLALEKDPANGPIRPLYLASLTGFLELVKHLIFTGSNVSEIGGYIGAPIHAAARQGHAEIVSVLMDAGADDISGENYGCALMLSSNYGHLKVVELLLRERYDFTIGWAREALRGAENNGYQEIAQLLRKASPQSLQSSLG